MKTIENLEIEESIEHNAKVIKNGFKEGIVIKRTPYNDLIISKNHIEEVKEEISKMFCVWVLNRTITYLDHSDDPYYDHSGKVLEDECEDTEELLEMYNNLREWAEQEYTGSSMPSFQSGYGLNHLTYSDKIDEVVREYSRELLFENIPESKDRDMWVDDTLAESLELDLEEKLKDFCYDICPSEAWDLSHEKVEYELMEEELISRLRSEERHKHKIIAQQFVKKYLSNLQNISLEMNDKYWILKLNEVLNVATKDELKALENVGLPLLFSNRAREVSKYLIEGKLTNTIPKSIKPILEKLYKSQKNKELQNIKENTAYKDEAKTYLEYILPSLWEFKKINNLSNPKLTKFKEYLKEKLPEADLNVVISLWARIIGKNSDYITYMTEIYFNFRKNRSNDKMNLEQFGIYLKEKHTGLPLPSNEEWSKIIGNPINDIKATPKDLIDIEVLAGFLDCYILEEMPISKNHIIDVLKTKGNINYGTFIDDKMVKCNKEKALGYLHNISENSYNILLGKLKLRIDKKKEEQNLIDKVHTELLLEYPDAEFLIKQLYVHNKDHYGIKVYVGDKGYLFDYNGTLEELIKELKEMIKGSLGK